MAAFTYAVSDVVSQSRIDNRSFTVAALGTDSTLVLPGLLRITTRMTKVAE
jgi:hypothetical protein